MLHLAREMNEPALLVTAHYTLGTVLVYLGEIVSAREHFVQGIALCDVSPHRGLTMPDGRDPSLSCRAQLSRVLWLLGYPDQALKVSEAARALVQELAQPLGLVFALFLEMQHHQFRREVIETQQCAEALIALARDRNLPQYAALAGVLNGWARTTRGPAAAGIARMRESLAVQKQMGSELSRPHFLALLAEALEHCGQAEEGLVAVAEALAAVDRTGERYYEAELHRLRGELLLQSGAGNKSAEAVRCFHRAIDIARRQRAKSLELRAAMSLVRVWRQQGRLAEAHAMLAAIYGWFTEGFETADLREAKALLDQPW